jgi:hypothetical protein
LANARFTLHDRQSLSAAQLGLLAGITSTQVRAQIRDGRIHAAVEQGELRVPPDSAISWLRDRGVAGFSARL